MHKIWFFEINWVDNLDSEISIEWIAFVGNIPYLESLKIPRPLVMTNDETLKSFIPNVLLIFFS